MSTLKQIAKLFFFVPSPPLAFFSFEKYCCWSSGLRTRQPTSPQMILHEVNRWNIATYICSLSPTSDRMMDILVQTWCMEVMCDIPAHKVLHFSTFFASIFWNLRAHIEGFSLNEVPTRISSTSWLCTYIFNKLFQGFCFFPPQRIQIRMSLSTSCIRNVRLVFGFAFWRQV